MKSPKTKPHRPKPKAPPPRGPYIEKRKDDGQHWSFTVLPSGFALIEALARDGTPQAAIGPAIGMSSRGFQKLLAKDDQENPVREAWERGHYAAHAEFARLLFRRARKGDTLSLIYASKALLGWNENQAPTAQVGVQIILPAAATDNESYARLVAERTQVNLITDQSVKEVPHE